MSSNSTSVRTVQHLITRSFWTEFDRYTQKLFSGYAHVIELELELSVAYHYRAHRHMRYGEYSKCLLVVFCRSCRPLLGVFSEMFCRTVCRHRDKTSRNFIFLASPISLSRTDSKRCGSMAPGHSNTFLHSTSFNL